MPPAPPNRRYFTGSNKFTQDKRLHKRLTYKDEVNVTGQYKMSFWYPRPDSNRHTLRRGILNPLRLPIPPLGHTQGPV